MNFTYILHGALGSSIKMSPFADFLFKKIYALPLDLPGHGGKMCDSEFSIELFSEYLKNTIIEKELQGCRIFGYSMGGYVALHCAAKNPGIIGEIVCLGTKFNWTPESAEIEMSRLNPDKIEAKVPAFAMSLKIQHHPCDWKDVVRKTAGLIESLGKGAALRKDDLAKVDIPVIIARGNKDEMVSSDESKWAAESIPNARYVELDNVGHTMERVDYEKIGQLLIPVKA